jgi:hypothetical protein
MHLKIKIGMFEKLSKPLKMDGIHISLWDVACLTFMQILATRKRGKMITHCFWFKILSLVEEIQHFFHYFKLWFWRWNELFSSIMCTWERMCLKKIWNKNLVKFSTFYKLQMIKHCCFPTFLEVPSFVPLTFDVIFKSNFSQCINVCSPTLLLLWGWALNSYLCINALVQDQSKYGCEQTIDNSG